MSSEDLVRICEAEERFAGLLVCNRLGIQPYELELLQQFLESWLRMKIVEVRMNLQENHHWAPGAPTFTLISLEDEYSALVEAIQDAPLEEIKPHARHAIVKFKFDHSLDGIETWYAWVSACCKKHRESFHRELRDSGATS